jgi:hypothetical protein
MIKFEEEGHKYTNLDNSKDIEWISVTKLIHQFTEKFDAPAVAEKCSKGKNPKYKGKSTEEILEMWNNENKRAIDLGSWYHNQREKDVLSCNTITRDGIELPIISPIIENGIKLAPDQSVTSGVYPEHLVYLKSVGVCGQADRVEIVGNKIDIYDYKTNKEIKTEGYKYWDGTKKMMLGPLRHLEDCEFNTYALQLSVYMFIMLKHNYNLEPGTLEIHHIEFEIESEDENGYPVYAIDAAGDPIISKVTPIELPYLKKEVMAMFKWLNINRKQVLYNEH